MSNMSCIGFLVEDQQAFASLLERLAAQAIEDAPDMGKRRHLRWTDASGASVAFHLGKNGIECITPFFGIG
jgi:hypothetical protein